MAAVLITKHWRMVQDKQVAEASHNYIFTLLSTNKTRLILIIHEPAQRVDRSELRRHLYPHLIA